MTTKKRSRATSRELSYTVFYQPIKGKGYQVSVPLLPGLMTYGRTFEEAQLMARDAILCHVQGMREEKEDVPSEDSVLQERIKLAV